MVALLWHLAVDAWCAEALPGLWTLWRPRFPVPAGLAGSRSEGPSGSSFSSPQALGALRGRHSHLVPLCTSSGQVCPCPVLGEGFQSATSWLLACTQLVAVPPEGPPWRGCHSLQPHWPQKPPALVLTLLSGVGGPFWLLGQASCRRTETGPHCWPRGQDWWLPGVGPRPSRLWVASCCWPCFLPSPRSALRYSPVTWGRQPDLPAPCVHVWLSPL